MRQFIAREELLMETIDWTLVIPAGFAVAIFAGGLFMLINGVWAARDK